MSLRPILAFWARPERFVVSQREVRPPLQPAVACCAQSPSPLLLGYPWFVKIRHAGTSGARSRSAETERE